ncbi:MAG: FTR1 family protein [Acidobacteriia bacterium]|nr:FTR1 family protein [Terriglobia bacterium]
MFQAFIITLREGVEAFLIVAISIAFLKKSGRAKLLGAVYWGTAVSVALSIGFGMLLRQGVNQSLWEGILAAIAAVLVGTLILYMWRAARTMKRDIETRLEAATHNAGRIASFAAVFFFTLLMITREGMEAALLLISMSFQLASLPFLAGAILGLFMAAAIALLWARYGHRVNLGLFFQTTAIFLLVFVVQLFIYSFHELCEAGVFPNSEALHAATEPYGPDGHYGRLLSYSLVFLPVAWLLFSSLLHKMKQAPHPALTPRTVQEHRD